MPDMFDSGMYTFGAWSREMEIFIRDLGPFNPNMTAEEANRLLDQEGKITESDQQAFMRGWRRAQAEFKAKEGE